MPILPALGDGLLFRAALGGVVLLAGFVVGARYGLAVVALRRMGQDEREAGAMVTVWDLAGSMAGAASLLLFFLPVHGFAGMAAVCATVVLADRLAPFQ